MIYVINTENGEQLRVEAKEIEHISCKQIRINREIIIKVQSGIDSIKVSDSL